MKVFLANFQFHPPREYQLRSAGARRLVSYADSACQQTTTYWSTRLRAPHAAVRRPQYQRPRAPQGLVI